MPKSLFLLSALVFASMPVCAAEEAFATGPALEEFGPVADVKVDTERPADIKLKHSFDAREGATPGELNRTLESAARFLNMHARAGYSLDNIELAVIVHSVAVKDVTTNERYQMDREEKNANIDLVEALVEHGVQIIVCGQSAAYYDIENSHLLPGVSMALSAMTAHATLQQKGYSINPF